jgi:hypothetical protein
MHKRYVTVRGQYKNQLGHPGPGFQYDNTKDNGEVLVRKTIPRRRVIGYFAHSTLKNQCDLSLWLGICENATATTFKRAVSQLNIDSSVISRAVISSFKMRQLCVLQDGIFSPLSDKDIFDAFSPALAKGGEMECG